MAGDCCSPKRSETSCEDHQITTVLVAESAMAPVGDDRGIACKRVSRRTELYRAQMSFSLRSSANGPLMNYFNVTRICLDLHYRFTSRSTD